MKVLNLYSGIGGNRKLWDDVEVVAVEMDPGIAEIYKDLFPDDKVIIDDAHEFLLNHYNEYDFIWISCPCTSHSIIRCCGAKAGRYTPIYPDLTLYQEIIFLRNYCQCPWVVENVEPYYKPLIPENVKIGRHLFWSNIHLPKVIINEGERTHNSIRSKSTIYEINLSKYKIENKVKILRNMVNPKIGKYILDTIRDSHPPIEYGLFEKQQGA